MFRRIQENHTSLRELASINTLRILTSDLVDLIDERKAPAALQPADSRTRK